jgi:hypothetical protein
MSTDLATQEIYWLAEFPDALEDLESGDLWSLKARLQDLPDPELDTLYEIVCNMTASAA